MLPSLPVGAGRWLRERLDRFVEGRLGPEYASRSRSLAVRQNEFGYDPFGFSRNSMKYAVWMARFLYRDYFRAECYGIENVPSGRVLLVANHSGQLPFDGMVIGAATFLDADPPRMVRSMVEYVVPTIPFVSYLFSRWGQITGTPENCKRLLENDEAILVFPEGARGISKPYSQRYQLQHFGLGFMRLALETRTPIVPVAVIGAEEQAPSVNVKPLARLLGMPSFPLALYPPFIPLPLPVKYHIHFGEAQMFEGDPDDDDEVLEEMVTVIKNRIQSMLHIGLRQRQHVFR